MGGTFVALVFGIRMAFISLVYRTVRTMTNLLPCFGLVRVPTMSVLTYSRGSYEREQFRLPFVSCSARDFVHRKGNRAPERGRYRPYNAGKTSFSSSHTLDVRTGSSLKSD